MTTRQQKREKRSQLIHQLQRLEIQHQLISGTDFIISQCEGCEICTKIRAIGEELSPSNVDICTASGLTVERYHELCKTGISDKEIAIEIMVSPNSLKNWKQKFNVTRKRLSFDLSIDVYNGMREQGLTNAEIAKQLNTSIRVLGRWTAKNKEIIRLRGMIG